MNGSYNKINANTQRDDRKFPELIIYNSEIKTWEKNKNTDKFCSNVFFIWNGFQLNRTFLTDIYG